MAYRIHVDLGRILELMGICVCMYSFFLFIYLFLNQWILFSQDQPLFATRPKNKQTNKKLTNFLNREITRCGHLFCFLFVRDWSDNFQGIHMYINWIRRYRSELK